MQGPRTERRLAAQKHLFAGSQICRSLDLGFIYLQSWVFGVPSLRTRLTTHTQQKIDIVRGTDVKAVCQR